MAVMTNSKLNKNSVFFRFASEGSTLEKVEFYGKEIAVGDLRHTIAERKKLNKVDLEIINEKTNEVFSRDGHLLQRNIIVTVRRTPVQTQKKPTVVQIEDTDPWAKMEATTVKVEEEKPPPPEERPACPPEYLCPLCTGIFESPSIARCCGRSACGRCFAERSLENCPLCGRPCAEEQKPIPNLRLAAVVDALDVDYFDLPPVTIYRQKEAAPAKVEQVIPAVSDKAAHHAPGLAASAAPPVQLAAPVQMILTEPLDNATGGRKRRRRRHSSGSEASKQRDRKKKTKKRSTA
eukprot:TRINITY_DN48037_c0_g1_i1.p1 TRINITY_DN48037_c0_g1~~TRINITY_DN48037_c0_g1_i1.p1  ORF type:complete len:292 (+),score=63.48 TRINITY_DN48037_c0_g1_i1:119-994(+)